MQSIRQEPRLPRSQPLEPAVRRLVERIFRDVAEAAVDDLKLWPRRLDGTQLGPETIIVANLDLIAALAIEMDRVASRRAGITLPKRVRRLAKSFANLSDYDVARVAFSPAARIFPPALLARLVEAYRGLQVHQLTVVVGAVKMSDPRADWPGKWASTDGFGASINVVALAAECSVATDEGREALSVVIASRALARLGLESEGAMFARLVDSMLDDVEAAASLLDGMGDRSGAALLRRLPIVSLDVSYGPPWRRGSKREYLTKKTFIPYLSQPFLASLATRGRAFLVPALLEVEDADRPDEPTRAGISYRPDANGKSFRHDQLVRTITRIADLPESSAARQVAERRLGAHPVDPTALRQVGVSSSWWVLRGTAFVRGDRSYGGSPLPARLLVRIEHGLVHVFLCRTRRGASHSEAISLLLAAERQLDLLHRATVEGCIERYFDRAGDLALLRGSVSPGLRAGMTADIQAANIVYVVFSKLG